MNLLITGVAGFIGFHTALFLLKRGDTVIGIDNINDYYDTQLKLNRLELLNEFSNFTFQLIDIASNRDINKLFYGANSVIHLAARPGVRDSSKFPQLYIKDNIDGFNNVIEHCRMAGIKNFIYASSSSVYGASAHLPFREDYPLQSPGNIYAATKICNEQIASAYSANYCMNCTGLRFFTVYGPFGRPDMAIYKFTDAIMKNTPITIYNDGEMSRDFTYIDDAVKVIITFADNAILGNNILNVGSGISTLIKDLITDVEKLVDKKAVSISNIPQNGEITNTLADITRISTLIHSKPTDLTTGLEKFINWYRNKKY